MVSSVLYNFVIWLKTPYENPSSLKYSVSSLYSAGVVKKIHSGDGKLPFYSPLFRYWNTKSLRTPGIKLECQARRTHEFCDTK